MPRPRTVSFPPDDMIELGKEMVAYVSNKNNKVLHLSEWYTIEKMFTYKQFKNFCDMPEFSPYYEKALKIIGKKYLDGTVKDGIANRWLRSYFQDLTQREDRDAQERVEREKAAANPVTAPNDASIDTAHENLRLKAKIAELEAKIAN